MPGGLGVDGVLVPDGGLGMGGVLVLSGGLEAGGAPASGRAAANEAAMKSYPSTSQNRPVRGVPQDGQGVSSAAAVDGPAVDGAGEGDGDGWPPIGAPQTSQ